MTLMSKVGGAAGPLYGTAFLRAATAVGDAAELDAATLARRPGCGPRRRGGPRQGRSGREDHDRRLDSRPSTPQPQQRQPGADPAAVLDAAATAAEAGAVATDPLIARKGRASYLGERAIGHRDPGAASSALILRAAANAAGVGA